MSWRCKNCETDNEDSDDICVVCNSIPPVLVRVNCSRGTNGITRRFSWKISNANKVTIEYEGTRLDVSKIHYCDLIIKEGAQLVFEAENDVARRIFPYLPPPPIILPNYCTVCGYKYNETDIFCPKCGNRR